jgi:CcmD family protein
MPIYLVAAYAVFWIVTFVFVLSLWVRQRHIERDIAALERQLEIARGEN